MIKVTELSDDIKITCYDNGALLNDQNFGKSSKFIGKIHSLAFQNFE